MKDTIKYWVRPMEENKGIPNHKDLVDIHNMLIEGKTIKKKKNRQIF